MTDPSSSPSVGDAHADLEPLAPRARLLFYLQAFSRLLLFWLPVSVAGALAGSIFWSAVWAPLIALGWLFAMFMLALWWPSLAFDRWGYALREEDLIIARGVLFRSVTAIPLGRIQHVDTRQGPLEQWFGLARVQIYTASGVGADGVIPGLELDVAEALRDRLVEARGDDGV